MNGTVRGIQNGYAIWEFQVFSKQITSIRETNGNCIPNRFALYQNYPNPFNPSTTITYPIPKRSFATLKIFDALGREITSLTNENQEAGFYKIQFDGHSLSSGIYFIQLKTDGFIDIIKCTLIK